MIAVMIGGAVAMVISLIGSRYLIGFFRLRGKGQPILGKEDRGPDHHQSKSGTPTMGGLAIVMAALIGWLVAHGRSGLVFSDQALVIWGAVLVLAFMGFLDDYIKVRKSHNRGIFWKKKSYITLGLSIAIAWVLVSTTSISQNVSITRANLPGWHLPWFIWIFYAGVIIWATSNAVNVTDGLDGLAGGSALLGFLAFTIIAYWVFRNPQVYHDVVNPLDLAVLAASFAGACGGFLWFNAAPARIFMGDVGALGIGSALALLALTTDTQLLLILICGINVMEAGSVAVQMGVFKASGRTKRLFRMSPIHHHFELVGWPETTVIIRFWLISGVCVATALALFIGDFTHIDLPRVTCPPGSVTCVVAPTP
ncbi:MAG: mraY [Ilumatobacteraceae bacterium]|nr:mraY [Ilumatobacteraceae bacterium]